MAQESIVFASKRANRLLKRVCSMLMVLAFLLSTAVLNICTKGQIRATCAHFNSTRKIEECFDQRQTVFLFAVFCVVRITTYRLEVLLTKRYDRCLARKAAPGHHLGLCLGVPYLARKLLIPAAFQASAFTIIAIFLLSVVAFYPYGNDFFTLIKLIFNGVQRRFYNPNHDVISAFVILYLYFSVFMIIFLDVSTGLYCPQYLFGIPLIFPNINFPLILYIMHCYITAYHKKMPVIVYEVNEEDIFVQVNRMRCLCQKDCPQLSHATRLPIIPSMATTRERRLLQGRIVQKEYYRTGFMFIFYVGYELRYILAKRPAQKNLRKLEMECRGHAVQGKNRLDELNTMVLPDSEYIRSEKCYGAE